MTPWWMIDVLEILSDAPDHGWSYKNGFSYERYWDVLEQQWADSIGLGINAKGGGK